MEKDIAPVIYSIEVQIERKNKEGKRLYVLYLYNNAKSYKHFNSKFSRLVNIDHEVFFNINYNNSLI